MNKRSWNMAILVTQLKQVYIENLSFEQENKLYEINRFTLLFEKHYCQLYFKGLKVAYKQLLMEISF